MKIKIVLLAVMFFLFGYVAFAQSSPMHSAPHSTDTIPARTDHPTGSSEKQTALENSSGSTDQQSYSGSSYSAPAPVYEPAPDHTTSEDVDNLATKYRKIREAREAKAKKEKEDNAKKSNQ